LRYNIIIIAYNIFLSIVLLKRKHGAARVWVSAATPWATIRTCSTGTCSPRRGGGGNVGRHRERARAPPSAPRLADRSALPAGRVAAVTLRRRRARTRPASARARVSATTAATG